MSENRDGEPRSYCSPHLEPLDRRRVSLLRAWLQRGVAWVAAHRNDVLGGALLGAGLCLALALGTASALDEPALTWPVAEPRENLLGAAGAWLSGRMLYWLGLAALVPVLLLLAAGMWLLLRDDNNNNNNADDFSNASRAGEANLSTAAMLRLGLRLAPFVLVGLVLTMLGVAGLGGDGQPVKPHSPALGGVVGFALFDAASVLGGPVAARLFAALLAGAGLLVLAWPLTGVRARILAALALQEQRTTATDSEGGANTAAAAAAQANEHAPGESATAAAAPVTLQRTHADEWDEEGTEPTEVVSGVDALVSTTRSSSSSSTNLGEGIPNEAMLGSDTDASLAGEFDTSEILRKVESARYSLPPLELLPAHAAERSDHLAWPHAEQETAMQLVEALAAVHLPATLTTIERGPNVLGYELELGATARMPQLSLLEHELSLVLRDDSVRVLPVTSSRPGHAMRRLRVEVPRHDREPVTLHGLMSESKQQIREAHLPLILGRDRLGKPLIVDLARTGPLLIGAANDAAKSHTTALSVLSLLLAKRPHEAQLVLIDPSQRALGMFDDVPHLRRERARNTQQAVAALYDLVAELTRRKRHELEQPDSSDSYPALLAVIDELADLLLGQSREVEGLVERLAREGANWGIYLVVATNRPSVDVCTQSVKAGFAARLALRVASTLDSRTVLDLPGAQRLLEHGDALLRLEPGAEPLRCQVADVEPEAVEAVIGHVRNQPVYHKRSSHRRSRHPESESVSEADGWWSVASSEPFDAPVVDDNAGHGGDDHGAASASTSATSSNMDVPIAVIREEMMADAFEPGLFEPVASPPGAHAGEPDTQAFVTEEQLVEVDAEVDPNAETVVDEPLLVEVVRAQAEELLDAINEDQQSVAAEAVAAIEPEPCSWDEAGASAASGESGPWHLVEAEPFEHEQGVPADDLAALPEAMTASELSELELDAELDAWEAASHRWSAVPALADTDPFAVDDVNDHRNDENSHSESSIADAYDLRFAAAVRLAETANGCSGTMLEQALGLTPEEAQVVLIQLESAGILEPRQGPATRPLRKRQAG